MTQRLLREATAVVLVLVAILVAVSLGTHSPLDPSLFHVSSLREQPDNLVGWVGATLSAGLLGVLGLTAFLIPVLLAVVGWRVLSPEEGERPQLQAWGWVGVLVAAPGMVELACSSLPFREGAVPCGGLLGRAEGELLGGVVGPVGRVAVLASGLLVAMLAVSGVSLAAAVERVLGRLRGRLARRREARERLRRERDEARDRHRVLERQLKRMESDGEYRGPVTVKELGGRGRFRIIRRVVPAAEADAPPPERERTEAATGPGEGRITTSSARRSARPRPAVPEPATVPETSREVVQEEFDFVEELPTYDLPKLSFLDPPEEPPARDSSALIEISKLVNAKCQEFKVRGEVVNIRTGPVITTYEFRLDSGVKIAAVQNLAEDLALALKVESVRIERIPGRATVGIEVPSPAPEVIRLRPLLDAPEFDRAGSLLTLALGVDIRGKPFCADLARMPHLLMGGFTGSGKSVGINAMIMSILYKATPDQVKFIFVDPKMVELGVYADIPHLLTPIITDPKKAANALGWAVAEMDIRYRLLAALGVRNLTQYNQLVTDPGQLRRALELLGDGDGGEGLVPLPFLVIIIDELADLMISSSRAVEESITRLAQKARAVGVHLICATQRPSVDILTGIIKANFPCRIAYKVRSKHDSRTIIDVMGAERLLGRGDMLFLAPGTSNLIRLHGPLVTEKEIGTVVRYAKRFGKPKYQKEIVLHEPVGGDRVGARRNGGEETEALDDPMFDAAARLVVRTRKASASFVQRRLRLGYTRAARLLEMMERDGLVGALDGSRGREVLVPAGYFGEVDEAAAADEEEEEEAEVDEPSDPAGG